MARSYRDKLLLIVLAGTALRLAWAATTPGVAFDIDSYRIAASTLLHHGLGFYGAVNAGSAVRWPYPPAYLPWTLLAHAVAPVAGFRFVVALPAVAADAALAVLAARILERRGATEAASLGAACLVAFGPIFALTSGYHGQIDSLAILPAVLALDRWTRGGESRALSAGVLLGVAASIKTPAGLVLLALLPTARGRGEAAALAGAMAAVAGSLLAPFALSNPHALLEALRFAGSPGEGGLSLVVQPSLSHLFVGSSLGVHASPATLFLHDHGALLLAPVLVAVAVAGWRRRASAEAMAVLLFLTVFVLGDGFSPRYAVWLLPFLLMAGRLRVALALQLALLVPDIAVYAGPLRSDVLLTGYVVVGIAIWAALLCWWLRGATALALPRTASWLPELPSAACPRPASTTSSTA